MKEVLDNVKEILNNFYDFLADHDFPTLLEASRKYDWHQIARSSYTWLIAIPLLIYLLWTKKFKVIIAIVSSILFLLLVQRTLSPVGETLSLHDLLTFISGAVALVGINFYLLFVRQ